MSSLARKVTVAAKALDRIKRGWATEIDTRRLKMTSATDCVLGQLFGGHANGVDKIMPGFKEFDVVVFVEPGARALWEGEIRKRLKKK